jgi:tetratricopeptide (TPR) repeat protein
MHHNRKQNNIHSTTKKRKMRIIKLLCIAAFITNVSFAQMDVPPSGGNPRAMVSEEVGITSITIKYGRPDVNKREGKIYGDGNLVPYGFNTNSFITNKNTAPWRAGANENTTITFEHDVKVEGKDIKAGTYGLHMALAADKATLIFSTQSDAWGSFYYEEKNDALRVDVKPVALDKSVEYLKYEFIEHKEKYCVIAMQWEKLSIPFKVEADVDNIVIARLRDQVTSQKGFNSTNMLQAAQYCLNKNINLEEALAWSIRAINGFQGQKSFITLRNLATAYDKLNRTQQADSTMDEALLIATANQYTAYGRQLIGQKRVDRAMDIFKASEKRYGDVWGVNNGLMSGYSAKGDFKNALKHAEKAMAQAPNDAAKKIVEGQITKLKEGKDINQ